ncbi:MAG: TlpA family protein disulfide reductase [Acidimicrobiales bacterium]
MTAIVLALTVAGITALGGGGSTTSTSEATPDGPLVLFDGSAASFSDFEGQPVVVNFWASWCPACVAELPEFQSAHEKYEDEVTFLGIANTDRRTAAEALAAEVGLTYTLADDPNGGLFRELELIAMPSSVFINADGQIEEVFGGQLNEEALAVRLEKLLNAS